MFEHNEQRLEKIARAVAFLSGGAGGGKLARRRPSNFPATVSNKPQKSDSQSLHALGSELYKPQDIPFAIQNIQATGKAGHMVDNRLTRRVLKSDVKPMSNDKLMNKQTATVSPLAPRSFL